MIRLLPDNTRKIHRAETVAFTFDGQQFQGVNGESLLAALMRSGVLHLRHAPGGRAARGAFCCMGLCQECVVKVRGSNVESCRLQVRDGLIVERA